MRTFRDDDAGYVAWLTANPHGVVVNALPTFPPSSFVVHEATCGSISRPLRPGEQWTVQYTKACFADRTELDAWLTARGITTARECGICRSRKGADAGVAAPAAGSHSKPDPAVCFAGKPIRVIVAPSLADGAGSLVIEGAQWLAEAFFRRDPSAVAARSYDGWIRATQADPVLRDRVADEDVTEINRTMAARSSHAAWKPVIERADTSWLTALDRDWDLFELEPADWTALGVEAKLAAAFKAAREPGLGLAVVTKVLHIKRPRLIPVLDSLVLEQIRFGSAEGIQQWVAAVAHIRSVGRANLPAIHAIRAHLVEEGLPEPTLVRVLDALLWASHPASYLFPRLGPWERVLRPSAPAGASDRA